MANEEETAHGPVRKRVEPIEPEPTTDPLEPRVGPLKPPDICPATHRPYHRYVGPYDQCGDCGKPAPDGD